MELLEGPIRRYAWGSHTAIAEIQGRRTPTEHPEAELWLGAHPASPALLRRATGSVPLTEAIDADPMGILGPHAVAHFGPRLPFLLKVLAAAQPLSLQAHPNLVQAAAGFDADQAAGLSLDGPTRTYADRWHKPELMVAVSEFDALCGFRDPGESAKILGGLGIPALAPFVAALNVADPSVALREAVEGLLTYPQDGRDALVTDVVEAAAKAIGRHPAYQLPARLATLYPGDVGIVVAMLLNQVTLDPGEAVWMPAGNLHAYLRGVGIEVMAASDNVLRGGLTPKRVNVQELLRVLRFEVLDSPVIEPSPVAEGVVTWPVPVADFTLTRASVDGGHVGLSGKGPRILFCLSGLVCCREEQTPGSLTLRGGQAAFVGDRTGLVKITGRGEVYQAGVG